MSLEQVRQASELIKRGWKPDPDSMPCKIGPCPIWIDPSGNKIPWNEAIKVLEENK